MDNRVAEPSKSPENISQQPVVSSPLRRDKVTFPASPPSGSVAAQDVEVMSKELRRKEDIINRLVGDIQLYMGKIKGYQTLGHLYQESKQECNHYKQKYDELAMKLDSVMKRLLPEKDILSEVGADVGDRDASRDTSVTFTTAADILYRTSTIDSELLVEHPSGGYEKPQRPTTIEKSPDIREPPSQTPPSSDHEPRRHRVSEESAGKSSSVDPKSKDGKSPSNSSASSPSFVCLGGSGLSSMDPTPTLESLPQEELLSIGNRPAVSDESLTDPKTLNDLLNDSSSSVELRALASDLLRVGSRAAKIERQARIQQILLNEMRSEKLLLEQQVESKQQELENIQEKYSALAERFQLMERNVSASTNAKSPQPTGWIKVENEDEMESSSSSISITEINQRSQIQKLLTQIAELEITNQNLSYGCEHSDKARQELLHRVNYMDQQLKDQRENDLRRQQDCDEKIFSLKKQREELESEKEKAHDDLMQEKQLRKKTEEQCHALREKVSQLGERIHKLERQNPLNLLESVRPPPFDFPAKTSELSAGSSTPGNQKLLNDLAILQQQVTIYKEDFDNERRDRELSQSRLDAVKLQLTQAKIDLESSQQQIKLLSIDLQTAQRDNLHLKEKFAQTWNELKVLKSQIRPPPSTSHHIPRQLSYGQFWTCQRCTFENPSIRGTCEMCGADARGSVNMSPESGHDLLTGRGKPSDVPLYEQMHSLVLKDRSPQPSSNRQSPKL